MHPVFLTQFSPLFFFCLGGLFHLYRVVYHQVHKLIKTLRRLVLSNFLVMRKAYSNFALDSDT